MLSTTRVIAVMFILSLFGVTAGTTQAQTAPASSATTANITGIIVDQGTSLPIANAPVELDGAAGKVAETTTDSQGGFTFRNQPPGAYSVLVNVAGYQPSRSDAIYVLPGQSAQARIAIPRAALGNNLREIGRVTTSGQAGTLQTTSVVTRSVTPELLQREDYLRVGDYLGTLPGVDLHGTSTTVGDDLYVDIRGLKQSESQTLLDGHTLGPVGVGAALSGSRTDGFNFQDSPIFALRNIDITFGSGALGLYGTDSVAGTINLETLEPTRKPSFTLKQGIGDQGRQFTAGQATGTVGKLGYALVHGVQGTYGIFSPNTVAQTGTRGVDFTDATLAADSYTVTGNYVLRNDLAKFSYALSPATKILISGFSATSWDDKTGEGDNDYNTFDQQLANAPVTGATPSPGGCTTGLVEIAVGSDPAHSTPQCITPTQFAQGSSGPAGGGPGAWQSIAAQDYHGRLNTTLGRHTFTVDGFIDNYGSIYHRDASALQNNLFIINNRWATGGVLLSDSISTSKHDFGFGYYTQSQVLRTNQTTPDGAALVSSAPLGRNDNNFFIRDVYTPTNQLSLFLNAWYEKASTDSIGNFDPRLSIIFRPTGADVVRLTGGRSVGEPSLVAKGVSSLTASSALNPNCGGIANGNPLNVGSTAAPDLKPEKATDLEFAYGHRFFSDTNIGITLYDTNLTNQINSGNVPATGLTDAQKQAYLDRVTHQCGHAYSLTDPSNLLPGGFAFSGAFNAATARAKGIEISGRARASKQIYFDYAYDVQSLVLNDLANASPTFFLKNNPQIIPGSQLVQIPLHKANLAVDYTSPTGFEFRLDGNYVSDNNPQALTGFAYANASFNQVVSKNMQVNLGVQNIFNSHSDTYGRIGWGLYYPENAFGGDGGSVTSQGTERFGLAPTNFTLSLTSHI